MEENRARRVVDALREHGVNARVAKADVYRFGIRVALPDGREALWDADGTAGLEANVLRDGVLVGFVPKLPARRTSTSRPPSTRYFVPTTTPRSPRSARARPRRAPLPPRGRGVPPVSGRLPLPLSRVWRTVRIEAPGEDLSALVTIV